MNVDEDIDICVTDFSLDPVMIVNSPMSGVKLSAVTFAKNSNVSIMCTYMNKVSPLYGFRIFIYIL